VASVEPEEIGAAIDSVLEMLSSSLDAEAWDRVTELARLLTDLYGAGLARTLEVADDPGLPTALARDPLVAPLLALHGLHPEPLEVRARAGVAAAVRTLAPAGARARVVEVDADSATVRVQISGQIAPGAAARWEAIVRGALGETAPEASVEVTVDDPPAAPPAPSGSTHEQVPVAVRLGSRRVAAGTP
jgi:hypothetical protein